jgi:hypothetical protein
VWGFRASTRNGTSAASVDASTVSTRGGGEHGFQEGREVIRALALGAAIALVVFVISGGHVFFLPLLFVPLGLFSFGHRHRRRRYW